MARRYQGVRHTEALQQAREHQKRSLVDKALKRMLKEAKKTKGKTDGK